MFQVAASRYDVGPAEICGIEFQGQKIALYIVDTMPFATSDICPRCDSLLSDEGDIDRHEIGCSACGSRYDLRTGRNVRTASATPLETYPVQIRDDKILVDLGSDQGWALAA